MLPFTMQGLVLVVLTVGLAEGVNRPLAAEPDLTSLQYLTTGMSQMSSFRSDILNSIAISRVSDTDGNRRVQQYIKSFLSRYGWTIEEDIFTDSTPYGQKYFNNIIGTFNPSKPTRVVLACHYDSKLYSGTFIGAMDSAAPCSILLESIKQLDCLLKHGPGANSPVDDVTLQLVFFDGEEAFYRWSSTDSTYGARHLAAKWDQQREPDGRSTLQHMRELILLDLIGPTDTGFHMEFSSTSVLYKNLVATERSLRSKNLLTGRHSATIFHDQQGSGSSQDDHLPFMAKHVDIMHLISTPFPSVWHRSSDDVAHLDFDLIDDFSRIFRVFVTNMMHLRPNDRTCK